VIHDLADTGQYACYEPAVIVSCAGTGQDGAYTSTPPSYTVNPDLTIADNNTGLTWQRCTMGLSGNWCFDGSPAGYNWYQATGTTDPTYNPSGSDVCASSTVAGGGWRLPTDYEFVSLFDYVEPNGISGYFPEAEPGGYWTTAPVVGISTIAWTASNVGRSVSYQLRRSPYYVRCVRGATTSHAFVDNGDGTVTDSLTNLMVQKCPAGQSGAGCATGTAAQYSWESALQYCVGLSLAGHADWRLPNARELYSILDTTRTNPAINPVFAGTPSSFFWTSTTDPQPNYFFKYSVNFGLGGMDNNAAYNNTFGLALSTPVRCVR
jgi:hypothetical protein